MVWETVSISRAASARRRVPATSCDLLTPAKFAPPADPEHAVVEAALYWRGRVDSSTDLPLTALWGGA